MDKDELNTAAAALEVGLSERTLERDRKKENPSIPFYRKGRLVRYSKRRLQIYNENLKKCYPKVTFNPPL